MDGLAEPRPGLEKVAGAGPALPWLLLRFRVIRNSTWNKQSREDPVDGAGTGGQGGVGVSATVWHKWLCRLERATG